LSQHSKGAVVKKYLEMYEELTGMDA